MSSRSPSLPEFNLKPQPKATKTDLAVMTQEELLALRDQIDEKLTNLTLEDVNLVKESLIQLKKAKILQGKAQNTSKDFPLNQQAQVLNALSNIIKELSKVQAKLFDSEQRKRLQAATIKMVKTLPAEAQILFFEQYEPVLQEAQRVMESGVPEEFIDSDTTLDDPDPDDAPGAFGRV